MNPSFHKRNPSDYQKGIMRNQIKPLFRKQFPVQSRTPSVLPVSTNEHKTKEETPETEPEINFEIKKLLSERLNVIKELISYEDKFEHKLSTSARLHKMLELSSKLENKAKEAQSSIQEEKAMFQKLASGIEAINNLQQVQPTLKEEAFETETKPIEFEYCAEVSGVVCLAYIKADKQLKNWTIHFHPFNTCEVFEFELEEVGISVQEAVLGGRFLKHVVHWDVMPYFYFTSENSRMTLCYDKEHGLSFLSLIATLEGSNLPYVSLHIEEKDQGFLISVKEPQISQEQLTVEVDKTRLGTQSLLEVSSSKKQAELKSILQKKLMIVVKNQKKKLMWVGGISMIKKWFAGKFFEEKKIKNQPSFEPTLVQTYYGEYDIEKFRGCIEKLGKDTTVLLSHNTITDSIVVTVKTPSQQKVIREEHYQSDFELIRNLQFDSEISYYTLFKSLELRHLLFKLL